MQSSVFLEVIVFGLIAFVLITKLINMLGEVDEDDPMKSKSFFGEPARHTEVKNVKEASGNNNSNLVQSLIKKAKNNLDVEQYKNLITANDDNSKLQLINELKLLGVKISKFDPVKFLDNAQKAFQLTVDAVKNKIAEDLGYLVDKRFLGEIENAKHESLIAPNLTIVSAKISEVYSFGNSVFIKVLFELGGGHQEEWVFIKNLLDLSPAWYISSISTITSYN